MIKNDRVGVIYCATSDEYIQQATLSANSLKKYNPKILCSICTHKVIENSIWDKIILIEKNQVEHNQYVLDKLIALTMSPYEYTLYLDADTYVMDDIAEIFQILEKFDLALCHGHDRMLRFKLQHGLLSYRGIKRKVIGEDIPYSFSPIQSGLLLYKNNLRIKQWLTKLLNLYQKKMFFDDQVSIRELLWKTNIRFYILPPEYNFNSIEFIKNCQKNNFKEARPKIFHYTKHKNENIEKLTNFIYKRKRNYIQKLIYKIKYG